MFFICVLVANLFLLTRFHNHDYVGSFLFFCMIFSNFVVPVIICAFFSSSEIYKQYNDIIF
jgi:hypothetical protein